MGFLTARAFHKLLAPLQRRVFLMLGRAVLIASKEDGGRLYAKMTALSGETLEGVEIFQQYGYASRPLSGAENIIASISGDRSHTVGIASDDDRYRPDIEEGESILYTHEDKTSGGNHRFHMKKGRIAELKCVEFRVNAGGTTLVMNAAGVTITTPKYDIKKAGV